MNRISAENMPNYSACCPLIEGDKFSTEKIDICFAGCIFAELLIGKVLFQTAAKPQEPNPQEVSQSEPIFPSSEQAPKYSETKFQTSGIHANIPRVISAGLEFNPKRR
jgi:hypothetical protein